MSWLGKAIGGTFGFVMGGPLGAVLGAALGHQFDQQHSLPALDVLTEDPEGARILQWNFMQGIFRVMGCLAKLDGRVSEAEIRYAQETIERMGLDEKLRLSAVSFFNEGKHERFVLSVTLDDFRSSCGQHPVLLRFFMEVQLDMVLVDGPLNRHKEAILLLICDRTGFSRYEFFGIKARREAELRFSAKWNGAYRRAGFGSQEDLWRDRLPPQAGNELDKAYGILSLRRDASVEEIKKTYRRLISRHHPDKLVGMGHGSADVQKATECTQKIQKAYELISRSRGF